MLDSCLTCSVTAWLSCLAFSGSTPLAVAGSAAAAATGTAAAAGLAAFWAVAWKQDEKKKENVWIPFFIYVFLYLFLFSTQIHTHHETWCVNGQRTQGTDGKTIKKKTKLKDKDKDLLSRVSERRAVLTQHR